jgi:hypothetical protein
MIRTLFATVLCTLSLNAFALSIESVTLMADDGGQPGEEVDSFLPTDLVQHFKIDLDETVVGTPEFVVEFWAVETTAGNNRKITEFKAGAVVANTIDAKVSLPRDWPEGAYRLDVKMDGKLIGSQEYGVLAEEDAE